MRICVMGVQLLHKKKKKSRAKGELSSIPRKTSLKKATMERAQRATSSLSFRDENNSTLQTDNTEYNETSSLSSCITEFETFADEVKDGVPEVDFRGRVHRERSKSANDTRDDMSVDCSSQLSVRSEKHSGFIRKVGSVETRPTVLVATALKSNTN